MAALGSALIGDRPLHRNNTNTLMADHNLVALADVEKPNVRGSSPSRKAHLALGERLNRKPKCPLRLPVKKNPSPARRATAR